MLDIVFDKEIHNKSELISRIKSCLVTSKYYLKDTFYFMMVALLLIFGNGYTWFLHATSSYNLAIRLRSVG